MWKCVFYSGTGRGVAFGREAGAGEFMVELPPSECGWFNVTPERYQYVDGAFSERAEWQAEQQAKEEEQNARIARLEAIKAARITEGLKTITLEQAETYINKKLDISDMSLDDFDAAATQAQLKAAIRALLVRVYQALAANKDVHSREIPYILE